MGLADESAFHPGGMSGKQTFTPFSQVSTAPSSPSMKFRLDDASAPCSPASTALPGSPVAEFSLPELDEFEDLVPVAARRPRHERRARASEAVRKCREALKSPLLHMRSLLFLDIDGVLNVGVSDGQSSKPVAISQENLEMLAMMGTAKHGAAQALSFACSQKADGDLTYAELCKGAGDFVDAFVGRLAKIIQAAGPSTTVVLTSTWRLPQHAVKLASLERAIATKLKRNFTFKVRTPADEQEGPEGRLRGIERFLREHCERNVDNVECLRILVLEDFHIHPMGSWSCNGKLMACTEDVEMFLADCLPKHTDSSVKLIHTYDEWKTKDGCVQAGSGLTLRHFNDAMQFLDAKVTRSIRAQSM
mmetsp:Transcript_89921/g.160008  ORF Transcript_89921/g.160008 Transcript_89921/m.160008 type:complete len:362 (-) Transcript_89921:159-1244(-)|eukprot:CAMPEP_0197632510 /NCGR_PEP_ID=MMETSP1338-20131121/9224_1 /TAXON_ID=43686 ORGANISM="Pelagodinium beii, Strain RCC1491" /NCGR_SAMPLE_ID=MMETSP1338 /ASSEMBLY_ACC=CAM_ASM_000754 /LENGTH=361 /DNA_ID=CAMNT_0043204073 /DNA_START=54 /DNA_END=1139 /DNA_ORIENTATION=+